MGTRIGWRSATGCIRPAKRLERLIRGLSPGALAFLVLLAFARGPLDAADEAPNVRSQQNMEAAPAGVQSGQPPSGSPSLVIPGAQPSEDDRTLILPRSWRPTANEPTPPVPPPLAKGLAEAVQEVIEHGKQLTKRRSVLFPFRRQTGA